MFEKKSILAIGKVLFWKFAMLVFLRHPWGALGTCVANLKCIKDFVASYNYVNVDGSNHA
jgi:hypothetical protein